ILVREVKSRTLVEALFHLANSRPLRSDAIRIPRSPTYCSCATRHTVLQPAVAVRISRTPRRPGMKNEKGGIGMRRLLVSVFALLFALAMVPSTLAAAGGPPATFTTVNEGVDGTGHCKNGGTTVVNCNI